MRNEFHEIALKYGAGTLVAQSISLLSTILISHLYTPADYGMFISFLTLSAIMLPIITLKIESLIAISEFHEEVENYRSIAFQFMGLMCLALTTLGFLFLCLTSNFEFVSAAGHSTAFGLILYVQASSIVLVQVSLKSKLFNPVNLSGVLQNFFTLIFQTLFGLFKASMSSLEIAFILGRAAGLVPLRRKPSQAKNQPKVQISFVKVFNTIMESKNFIAVSFMEAMLIALPIYFIRNSYGDSYAGYLGLIQSIYAVPVSLIGSSIAAIAFSGSRNTMINGATPNIEHQTELIKSFVKPLFYIASIFILTSLLFGDKLFTLSLSSNWHEMTLLVPVLTLASAVNFFWYPFTSLMSLRNNSHKVVIGSFGRLTLGSAGFYLAQNLGWSWNQSAICFFVFQSIFQIIWMKLNFNN